MSSISRRGLLAAGGAGLASAALAGGRDDAVAPVLAASVDKQKPGGLFPPDRIGLQLYSIADQISSIGFARSFEALAEMGYRCIEFAGYTQGTTPEITPKELRGLLEANGLRAVGSHVSPSDDEALKQILADSATIGVPNVGISLPLPDQGPTAAGWTALSQTYNRWGEIAAKEGVGFYLHNHFHEWFPCPDDPSRRGEDILLAETDPRFVFFEMDVYWAHVGQWQAGMGFDPLHDYAIPFKDRYKLFHVKDGRKDILGGYTDALANIVDAGQGSIDFQGFFSTLFAQSPDEVNRHLYLWERDNAVYHPRGSMAAARASFAYIRYGLTGPNLPVAEKASNAVVGTIRSAGAKASRSGARTIRLVVQADEPVAITVRASRKGKTLARKTRTGLPAGKHTISLRVPRGVAAGPANVGVVFTAASGLEQSSKTAVVLP